MRTAVLRARADSSSSPLPRRCKKKVPASKRFTIHRTSNVLTLSLKRFANFSGGKITKVSTRSAQAAWSALSERFQALLQIEWIQIPGRQGPGVRIFAKSLNDHYAVKFKNIFSPASSCAWGAPAIEGVGGPGISVMNTVLHAPLVSEAAAAASCAFLWSVITYLSAQWSFNRRRLVS